MGLFKRLPGTRLAGLVLAGTLAVGLAAATGTAFAASGSSPASMAGMHMSTSRAHVGFTRGWYAGRTVRFYYTRNFFCRRPPASHAPSRCEAGANYLRVPSKSFDPLYVIVPLGFTPPARTIQCPAGHCIDHPHTIDLSRVLGSGAADVLLPAHSHIVATANGHKSEWWDVKVVGVKSLKAWDKIVAHKSDAELLRLQRTDPKDVTGNIATNLFLFFAVR